MMFNPVAEALVKAMEGPQQELRNVLQAILAEQKRTNELLVKFFEEPDLTDLEPPTPPTKLRAVPKETAAERRGKK